MMQAMAYGGSLKASLFKNVCILLPVFGIKLTLPAHRGISILT